MTTATGAAQDEKPWGFEHEPEIAEPQHPVAREYTFSIARGLVHIHGMVHSVADVVSALAGKVRSMADGPLRDPESEYERGVRAGVRRTTYVNGDGDGRREPNGEKRLLRWILGIVGALFVLATGGGITLYGEFMALRATVTTGMNAHEQRINRVEQRLDRASANTQ